MPFGTVSICTGTVDRNNTAFGLGLAVGSSRMGLTALTVVRANGGGVAAVSARATSVNGPAMRTNAATSVRKYVVFTG